MKSLKRILFLISFVPVLSLPSIAFSADLSSNQVLPQIAVVETVNINSSDAEAMASVLTGIGMKRAESIVAYRTENGAFKSIEELKAVKGIGDSIIEKNKTKIRL